jgi:predicted RNA-binding Zn-ribbon protein involved in translation (DUF1610 family)
MTEEEFDATKGAIQCDTCKRWVAINETTAASSTCFQCGKVKSHRMRTKMNSIMEARKAWRRSPYESNSTK